MPVLPYLEGPARERFDRWHEAMLERHGAALVAHTEAREIERRPHGFRVATRDTRGECGAFDCGAVVNAAGLAADGGRLRQMLHNLIRNAQEASDAETATIDISSRVVAEQGGAWLLLEMRDDGPGFPAAVLEQPFEPYVTSKSHGRGLGLAICRKIVSEHNGRISISNHSGGGARIDVLLPLNHPQSASRRTG